MDTYIYIDGIDGTGKTTLVKMLLDHGYRHVYDRSILTKLSFMPISQLPEKIPDNQSIIEQFDLIHKKYSQTELSTNRSIMDKLDLDFKRDSKDDANIINNVIYIILDADIEVIKERLEQRSNKNKIELDAWESDQSLKYFKNKYIYLGFKYQISIIDVTEKKPVQVYQTITNMIHLKNYEIYPLHYHIIYIKELINLDLIELEWLYFGYSKIIYVGTNHIIVHKPIKNFQNYQKKIIKKLAYQKLNHFIQKLQNQTFLMK